MSRCGHAFDRQDTVAVFVGIIAAISVFIICEDVDRSVGYDRFVFVESEFSGCFQDGDGADRVSDWSVKMESL